jgi:hypothetical protein
METKPTPVPKQTVCSVCGLDWERHAKRAPKIEGCVKLLKEELAKRPLMNWGWNQAGTGLTTYSLTN